MVGIVSTRKAKVRARLQMASTVRQRRDPAIWRRPSRADWVRVDATAEAEIERQVVADDDDAARGAAAWVRRICRGARLSQPSLRAGRVVILRD